MSLGPFRRNTTGITNPQDYLLGRGKLYYCELLSTDLPDEDGDGWVDVGNVPEFSVTSETNILDHFSSQSGLRSRDKRIVIDQAFNLSFQAEEFNEENALLWLFSTPAAATNGTIAGFVERTIITNVKKGRNYPIVDASGNRCTGFRASDLTLEKSGSPDTALTLNTDYTVDTQAGLVHILTTGAVLADGDEVDGTLVAYGSGEATRFVPLQNRTVVDVAMEFIGSNPDTGGKFILHLNKVSLSPDASLNLITASEMARMSFRGACERVPSLTYPVGWIMAVPSTPT